MRRPAALAVVGIVLLSSGLSLGLLGAGFGVARAKRPDGVQESKFFKVDLGARKVVAPSDRVAAALHFDLTSVTTDQPQYWPGERVYLRLLALGRPGAEWRGTLQKRDSQGRELRGTLDGQGVAVVEVLSGEAAPLELGEYRIDVSIAGGKAKGTATFAVVEGTLGALSFAHPFRKVTRADELDGVPGGWYLGNAAGAGARWGNGLSFKNELRASNHPYTGEVEVHSRCMLPGCNGVHAGPSQHLRVENGRLAGTLSIGGHSGPFQIEVQSARGSLRHQFEGSSHVERELFAISGGVGYQHRVGLAPYDGTVRVPGRDLFIESKKGGDDPFTVESVLAEGGRLTLRVNSAVKAPALFAHQPRPDGSFESRPLPVPAELAAGRRLEVEVRPPYTLVTIGGFVAGAFKEGWAVGLMPTGLKLELAAPESGRTGGPVPVTVTARDLAGKGVALSAILEVYDNRVPARSPTGPIGSAVGDALRSASRAVSSWVDNTGIVEDEDDGDKRRDKKSLKEESLGGLFRASGTATAHGLGMSGTGRGGGATLGYGAGAVLGGRSAAPARLAYGAAPGRAQSAGDDEVRDEIRQGDRKVVYCGLVTTDASGQARVEVTLPPQTGRMIVRLSAVRGLDYEQAQRELDVRRLAAAEARLPGSFVPGARLTIPVDTTNDSGQPLVLVADGVGLPAPLSRPIGPGHATTELPLDLDKPGTLRLLLRDAAGKTFDRRERALTTVAEQPVTWSRLVFGGADGSRLTVAPGETARVYAGSGPLLHGVVANVLTTTDSWFGHAEALSARVAVRSVLLAAFTAGLLDDEGLAQSLRAGVDKDVRDLAEAFIDRESGLARPYPGLPPSALWSAWVARNLLTAVSALERADRSDARVKQALATARATADRLRQTLALRGIRGEEQAGFDSAGQWVLPIEQDGKVVYRALTDDAVTRWATDRLLPRLDLDDDTTGLDVTLSKLTDTFRFLRAFERVGPLQYLTDVATAYHQKGDRATFARLYRKIARGLILSQEPGLLQGPALLGGVYSAPMALVRFLELQLRLGSAARPAGRPTRDGAPLRFEEAVAGPATLTLPEGAIARVDRRDVVRFAATPAAVFARASVSKGQVAVGEELTLTIELDPGRDPLEYYALVAVPTTTSVKQTEDILSDSRGQLIYGQQGQGGTQMQRLAVPFRGSRTLRLLLEGAYRGTSPGLVVVRHIESPGLVSGVAVPAVTVQ